MPGGKRALVIGGSTGGLFAANLLLRLGWDVTVYERSVEDLAGRGAGLGISAELLSVMRRIGARLDGSAGVDIGACAWVDADGAIRHEYPRPMMTSAWGRIYQPLKDAFPAARYRAGMTLSRVERGAAGVTALFTDGTQAEGELLVAADGVQSSVRRHFLPAVEPRYAGYVAWRGLVAESALSPRARDLVGGRLAFSFPEGEMMLAMPVPGEGEDRRIGHRRFYFIWYRPADQATMVRDLCTDAAGRWHGVTIPPPLIRAEHVAALKASAQRVLAPPIAEIVAQTGQPLLQPIFDLEAPRLVFGRVALLGDAAFIARPHVAAGATKAALNAACLADALGDGAGDVDAGLARYDRAQQEFGAKLVAHSRYLGAYLEGQLKPPAERRGDELARDPLLIMRRYGAPDLLHDADIADFG